jgi:putative toxin-antitoxin system antitoxin component (TIGR02293 family)
MEKTEQQRYATAFAAARLVFENDEDATGWLNEPSIPLGNAPPKSLLVTDEGLELVLYELGQMEYGQPV